ncbi:MAG: MBOAT family protein [Planctomycetes bacterium]|nr:MBOAT family protein [Planctomycetota bacterium]MCB9889971.1 MBOAT family protein [Planctomycetota bacterium]
MQFNSLAFVAFLAVVLPLYFGPEWAGLRWLPRLCRRQPRVSRLLSFAFGLRGALRPIYRRRLVLQNAMLVAASYVFYAWWDVRFVSLLLASTLCDYWIALWMDSRRVRLGPAVSNKGPLRLSLVINLGLLGVFKYHDFFVANLAALLETCGLHPNLPLLGIVVPVGISFYTFQTIAYSYSVYRGDIPAERSLPQFALYVAYFPQLVAGPIENAQRLLPQIAAPRRVSWGAFCSGCSLVLQGLFKKIAIADAAAKYVDVVFAAPEKASSSTLMLGTYMFALQIYGDFCGYTDIARGVSRAMGIELMVNFRQPYLATNITDFWRRWHISLSSWLRDHLYIPLGGNRHGALQTYRNLMLTMLLGGLWHGAKWTFVVWGGLHGVYLALHKLWTGRGAVATAPATARPSWGRQVVGALFTFHLVCIAWVFFRANDLETAWQILSGIVAFDMAPSGQVPMSSLGLLAIALAVDLACARRGEQTPIGEGIPTFYRWLLYGSAIVMMLIADTPGNVPFLYFQF